MNGKWGKLMKFGYHGNGMGCVRLRNILIHS